MNREEAIEQFKYAIDLIKQDGKDYLDERDIPMLKMGIEALENQKTGHWKSTTHYARPYRVCSVCGCERINDHSTGWNYCPNCGAKMEGENK